MNPFVKKYHQTFGTHCWYCDREYNGGNIKRTREHIIPASKLKQNDPKNYIGSCKDCNHFKGSKNAKQFALLIGRMYVNGNQHKLRKYFKMIMIRSWKLYNKTSKLHKKFEK